MNVTDYIRLSRKKLQEIMTDPETKKILLQLQDILTSLIDDKKDKVEIKITKWEEVNKTYELAKKGEELRRNYTRNLKIIEFVTYIINLISHFQ